MRGRDKVGFSVTGQGSDGRPVYIDGVRGVVERNTMRYYLAMKRIELQRQHNFIQP